MAAEWAVLLPLWKRWISSRALRILAACATAFVWLVVVSGIINAASGGEKDESDLSQEPLATTTSSDFPTGTISATPVEAVSVKPTETSTEAPIEVAIPAYKIVENEDISFGSAIRLRLKAVTDFPLSKDQAKELLAQIVQEAIGDTDVNAVVVFLYDREELIDGAYTIATATFAPEGRWELADQVDTGDYSSHETVYEYQPKMDNPGAALPLRPDGHEAQLCKAFNEATMTHPEAESDQELAEIAAVTLGVSAQEISDASFKCAFWAFA